MAEHHSQHPKARNLLATPLLCLPPPGPASPAPPRRTQHPLALEASLGASGDLTPCTSRKVLVPHGRAACTRLKSSGLRFDGRGLVSKRISEGFVLPAGSTLETLRNKTGNPKSWPDLAAPAQPWEGKAVPRLQHQANSSPSRGSGLAAVKWLCS